MVKAKEVTHTPIKGTPNTNTANVLSLKSTIVEGPPLCCILNIICGYMLADIKGAQV
jgi:hypothetical protein